MFTSTPPTETKEVTPDPSLTESPARSINIVSMLSRAKENGKRNQTLTI